jgi:uncharacterized protein
MMDQPPFTAAGFQTFLQQKRLMAAYCEDSQKLYLPPRAICPLSQSTHMTWRELSGRGTLAAFTVIYVGLTDRVARGHDRQHAYCTGIVELEEGVRISAQIVGADTQQPESIQIGSPVIAEYQTIGHTDSTQYELVFRVV